MNSEFDVARVSSTISSPGQKSLVAINVVYGPHKYIRTNRVNHVARFSSPTRISGAWEVHIYPLIEIQEMSWRRSALD